MAEVFGTIGREPVELRNAATEATLKLLLQATLAANKQTIESVSKIATKAGLDPAAVAAANENLGTMGKSAQQGTGLFYKLGFAVGATETALGAMSKAMDPMINSILGGSKNISDFGSELSKLPFGIGVVLGTFGKLAKIREQEFDAYQKMSNAGTNFGGSLTNLRMAAYESYLTVGELTNVMQKNRAAFAMMGGTVNDGAMAFSKMSGQLMQSEAGNSLRALGYSAEEVSNGLASYIQNTGGRNKQEMQNTKEITAGAKQYLEQLDGLAQITGKSREELEKESKARNQNAAYQSKLMGMTEAQRKATEAGAAEMKAKFGKAGEEMYMASVLGVQPASEAARTLKAMAPEVAKASDKMVEIGKRGGTLAETQQASAEASQGAATANRRLADTNNALSLQSGAIAETSGLLQKETNRVTQQGIKSAGDEITQREELARKRKDLETSQAATQVKLQNASIDLQKAFYTLLTPLIDLAGPILLAVGKALISMVETAIKFKEILAGLLAVGFAYWTFQKYKMATEMAQSAKAQGQGLLGQISSATGVGVGKLGATPTNAMWVRVAGGGGLGGLAGGGGGKGGAGGKSPLDGLGGGGDIGTFMKSLSSGLVSFANPAILVGAGIFAASVALIIAGIGAGVAAAMALIGTSLPTFSAGLKTMETIDGEKLGGTALGVAKLGAGLITWAPFAVFGIPAAFGLSMMADSFVKLSSVDPVKLEKVAAAMQKVKDATPGIGQAIGGAITGLTNKLVGSSEPVAAATSKPTTTSAGADSNNMITELRTLNKQITDVLKYIRETADHTKQNVSATKSLSGNHFNF